RDVYDMVFHLCNNRYNQSMRIAFQHLEKYPGDYFFNLFAGHNARAQFRPRLAVSVLDQIREPLPNNEWGIWHYYKVWNYTESLAMLGLYKEALNYLQSIPPDKYSLAVPHLVIRVLVSLGKTSQEL